MHDHLENHRELENFEENNFSAEGNFCHFDVEKKLKMSNTLSEKGFLRRETLPILTLQEKPRLTKITLVI